MFEDIKTWVENPQMSEFTFTLDQIIMNLHTKCHELALTRDRSYIGLP